MEKRRDLSAGPSDGGGIRAPGMLVQEMGVLGRGKLGFGIGSLCQEERADVVSLRLAEG